MKKIFKDNLNKINCNMEDYLNSLDTLYNIDNNVEDSCCNDHENHFISHEKISCRICGANIENISYLPEKSYENKNNSHY